MSGESTIPAEAVRAQLERILSSKGFVNAGRLSRLLRYVTDKTLAGEAEQLKEYSVGVEVFDRDASYDPRLDSIVRVEAGRLRTRLDDYYAGDGKSDPVRIDLPRGGYVAHFFPNSPAPVVEHRPSSFTTRASILALAGAVVLITALSLWLSAWRSRPELPSVAVLAFSEYAENAALAGVAAQLNDSVTSELARLGTVAVVSHTSVMQFAGSKQPLREIAAALDANFIMEATIEPEAGGIKVVARLVNAATDRKAWVEDFHGRQDDLQNLSREMATSVAAAILKIHPAR